MIVIWLDYWRFRLVAAAVVQLFAALGVCMLSDHGEVVHHPSRLQVNIGRY